MPELRKKSPRAPAIALDEALDRASKVYEKERLHAAPTDLIAQAMGYKSANNGAALSVMAALRYFGLLQRPQEGLLAVSRELEAYKYAPDESLRRSILTNFLKSPALYAELLEKYPSGLPSDANLRFELIQHRGFAPPAAESVLAAFRRSVEFAGYYDQPQYSSPSTEPSNDASLDEPVGFKDTAGFGVTRNQAASEIPAPEDASLDRIPVRLPGGRKAWLLIPMPFYEADKLRLKAQIDLLLTEDE